MIPFRIGWCLPFFFQAEDGIRALTVTGVQTCALPIFTEGDDAVLIGYGPVLLLQAFEAARLLREHDIELKVINLPRSEERRVGKECRFRWGRRRGNKKTTCGTASDRWSLCSSAPRRTA